MIFKDGKNKWITRGLFYELCDYSIGEYVQFTTGEKDITRKGKKLISLKQKFLNSEDPTEYEFATTYLGGWSHWKALLDSPSVKPHIEEWREELEIKIRSKAIKKMQEASDDGNYQASKFLADRGWDVRKAGAPSKAERAGQKKTDKKLAAVINADFDRLGIGK